MNRFLTRRKDRILDDNASGGKKSKKSKKGQPEPKLELDLATVLPSTDDFRTSLIMPSLSTRFSMLKEQDDPNSKLGKASDDSVLHPKRQSRLHEFGFIPGGLSDIAEVSSLHDPVRPPFANERQNSFDSQATGDGAGSMMSRARPGEGNVLFGGRQKVYVISNTGSSKNLGRTLYEDDVNTSTFQKWRQQEKQKHGEHYEPELERPLDGLHSEPSSPKDLYSPSLSGYSQRRETSSSTNSGTANTRTSTAATSIASQGNSSIPASSPALPNSTSATSPIELSRSTTKTRRLYDQGLDKHLYDEQSSALNRLNSIQRTRAPTGRSTPPLLYSQTRSATNLNDRFNRGGPLRTESPTMMSHANLGGKDTQSGGSSPIISRPQSPPPTSPLASDGEDAQTLNSALQHHDRGKATAMGAFNKPTQAFSEQQYAERLKRMQQERAASPPKLEKPRKPSLRERAEQEQRKRAEAGVPERFRSESIDEEKPASSAFSVFQQAANQMKTSPSPTVNSQPKRSEPSPSGMQSPDSQQGTTFFASPGSSDDEDEAPKTTGLKPDLARRLEHIPTIPANRAAPPILEHPALRSRSNSRPPPPESEHPALRSRSQSRPAPQTQDDPDVDSPTLGPNNGGLSGLIRQHLRNVSNVSSDYGDANQITMSPPPTMTTVPLSLRTQDVGLGFQRRQPASEADTPAHSSYSHSNPWDLEDIDNPYYGEGDSVSSTSPVDPHKPKVQAAVAPTTQTRSRAATEGDQVPQWERDLVRTHQRDPSTLTQEERDAFEEELQQRQRAIQESLRSNIAPGRSRDGSPAPAGGGLKTALSLLRSKSSRESFATVEHPRQLESNKAMRMLGIGANSANASSTSLAGQRDRFYETEHWRSEEGFGQRGPPPLRSKPSRVLQQSEQDAQRELEQRLQRSATDDSNREPRSHGRSPPTSSKSSTRNRSSSELSSGRSRSRPGRYRDDLEQAMIEGTSSKSMVFPPNTSPSVPGFATNTTPPVPADRPSLDSQQSRMRSRSNSRATTAAGYFESKHLQPIQTGNGPFNGTSPHLSPAVNSPKPPFASPGLPASPRPSPGAPSPSLNAFRPQASPVPPFSANNTPPVSGPNTPVAPKFDSNTSVPFTKMGTIRKKSIAKADISEPIFISGTSVVDTIELPAGASLKNGMEAPPPVPPLNPMRRRFGFGRSENQDGSVRPPQAPYAEPIRTNSSDALANQIHQPKQKLRKTSSEGKSLHGQAQAQAGASPAMPTGIFTGRNNSPPRPINNRPLAHRPMDGAMF
ncbi:hypothetical protein BDV96DRAFT_492252 [Lophiotrema nucula]|uniref:Uncharacterized protein n=1 Tax=Lophiotrema nucula TaxID=690887 RepID=A0A6A5ZAF5_9PLEO|nr:hypothetical protein BDV96DRAFT_492252 [Lophiotrema nucula]